MNLYLKMYLCGYGGKLLPRWIRKLIAKTKLHRAWLAGFMGIFSENGVKHGCLERVGFFYRK